MSNPNANIKEGFYSKLFARFYDPFMESMEQKVLGQVPQATSGAIERKYPRSRFWNGHQLSSSIPQGCQRACQRTIGTHAEVRGGTFKDGPS